MSKLNLKAEALAAYEAAAINPAADWRAVAEMLRAAIPTVKAKPPASDDWADYPVECSARKIVWPSPVVQVQYADGVTVRASFATLPGKPLNMGRAMRVAAAFYQGHITSQAMRAAVPAIAELSRANAFRDRRKARLDAHSETERGTSGSLEFAKWCTERDQLESAFTFADQQCRRLALAVPAAVSEWREKQADMVITVPAVSACHVEKEGQVIATFDAGAINARLGQTDAQ